MSLLEAGAAVRAITPPVVVDMCGFAARPGPSAGVHDDLMAKALFLTDGAAALALVTADLIALSSDQCHGIAEQAAARVGMAADAVMVSCSHTHSGPATPGIRYLGETDAAWMAATEAALVEAVVEAAGSARAAAVGWARQRVQIHINRRQHTTQGMAIGVNPRGTVLPWADVLAVDDADGQPLARWFTHACHAVVMGGDNLLLSADWPGYAQRTVEAAEPGCVGLFAQGCCGDLNPHTRGTFAVAERLGKAVAGAAIQGAAQAEMAGDAPLAYATATVGLPLQDPPPVEEAERTLAELEADYRAREAQMMYAERQWYGGFVEWARELVELSRRGATGLSVPFRVQGFRVGGGAIVGLPGEVFARYAISIGDLSPATPTAVVAYTNGYTSYVPTAAAFAEGGYEVDTAFRAALPTMLTPECEGRVLGAAKEAVGGLF
jgi:hypothetical protein